jgi:hypothetical protein
LARAIIVQQLHWRLQNQRTREINGETYISDTYADWCDSVFPFWTPETLRKYFADLEKDGLIISIQPDKFDRTKSYRVNYDKLRTYEILAGLFPDAEEFTNRSGNFHRIKAEIPTDSEAEDSTASLKDKDLKNKTRERERERAREPKRQHPFTDTEAESIYRDIFPDVVLSIQQAEIFALIDDLDAEAFKATCRLWAANNHNARHIGNLIDRYKNDLKKAELEKSNGKANGHHQYLTASEKRGRNAINNERITHAYRTGETVELLSTGPGSPTTFTPPEGPAF